MAIRKRRTDDKRQIVANWNPSSRHTLANHSLAVGWKIGGKRIMVRPKAWIVAQCISVLTYWAKGYLLMWYQTYIGQTWLEVCASCIIRHVNMSVGI